MLPLSRDPSPPLEPLEELSGDGGAAAEAFAHNCDDSASISSFSLGGGAGSTSLPRSRQGLSPEQEETASLVSTGTLVPEGIYLPPPGYQLVPDNQWEQLQMEVSGGGGAACPRARIHLPLPRTLPGHPLCPPLELELGLRQQRQGGRLRDARPPPDPHPTEM